MSYGSHRTAAAIYVQLLLSRRFELAFATFAYMTSTLQEYHVKIQRMVDYFFNENPGRIPRVKKLNEDQRTMSGWPNASRIQPIAAAEEP